jgi:chromate transporter
VERDDPTPSPPDAPRGRLREVAGVFLRLGVTAFGGPAAHVAMMEDQAVTRRRWLSRERFLDLLGAANLLPGPSSSELAIYLGYARAGWPGLAVGGACFIAPAAVLTGTIAWAYVRYGRLPGVAGVLYGVKPAVIAVVLQAVVRLGRSALKTRLLAVAAVAAAVGAGAGVPPLAVLAGGGLVVATARRAPRGGTSRSVGLPGLFVATATTAAGPPNLGAVLLVFLKLGAVVFGSGYVLLAFLRADLVEHRHWLTEQQLVDAVAVGQVTPGPVFTTATFIGYVVAGVPGAVVATVGVFLPAFALVAASGPLVPRLRRSPVAADALDGVNGAAVALMAVVTWQLGRAAIIDPVTAAIAVVSAVALLGARWNATWVMAAAAAAGLGRAWVVQR